MEAETRDFGSVKTRFVGSGRCAKQTQRKPTRLLPRK
ncbi:amino-acid acetyltransferase domain protein [Burkholderia pseudomallei TSV5]|nr:amino-acid acetyltransferase domain protein [Burkholderia pseudomallei]KGD57493.1 amino-acid acetyltransferase domain protein [Burkholderia pseudomallei]KGX50641.1 amino-acid acetyltransferase domain protein [Burkholderia pseudomallei TSV5]